MNALEMLKVKGYKKFNGVWMLERDIARIKQQAAALIAKVKEPKHEPK